jgi:hypothetical protein
MTKRPKYKPPLYWTDIIERDGTKVLGRYAVDNGIIIVRSAEGWEKRTHCSAGGANEGLARLILFEPPPP